MKKVLIFLLLLLAVKVDAATYWASPTATDDSVSCATISGTTDPGVGKYRTVRGAIECATSGSNTIIMKSGTYTVFRADKRLLFNSIASNTVVTSEDSNPANWPVFRPTASTTGWYGFRIDNAITRTGVIVKNFRIDFSNISSPGSAQSCMGWHDSANFNMIVENFECLGPPVGLADDTAAGIGAGVEGGTTIRNGTIRRWHGPAPNQPGAHGIYWQRSNGTLQNLHISDTDGKCFQIYNGSSAVVMENNVIDRIYCTNNAKGITIEGGSSANNTIKNSVFYNSALNHQFTSSDASRPNKFINNTIYQSSSVGGPAIQINSSNCIMSNNLIITTGSATLGGTVGACGVAQTNITSSSATPSDYFVNASTGDLRLKSTSPAIGGGTTRSEVQCNGTCSRGAFQPIPITGHTAVASDSSVDLTLDIDVANQVPILPATGITGFTLTGGTVVSQTRFSDTVVRLTYTGTCSSVEGGTLAYSPGNLTTARTVGDPNDSSRSYAQAAFAFSGVAIGNSCGGGVDPAPPGLFVHYKLDDGSGTNANDETANNNDGTLTGGPTWVTGRTGQAVEFANAVQDYITVPYGNAVNPSTQSLTIAMDVNFTTTDVLEVYFGASLGTNQRLYLSREANNTLAMGIQSSSSNTNTEFAVTAGTWYRVCIVLNSSTDVATLHLNGVAGTSAQSVKSYTSYTLASNFDIGRANGFTTQLPGVIIDNFKLWTSAESCLDDYKNEWPQQPTPTATFSQQAYSFYLLRKDSAGNLIKLPSPSVAVNTAISVPAGAVLTLEIQTNCDNVADCAPIAQNLQYDASDALNTWLDVSDNCSVDWCFYGTADSNPNIPSGVPACPLSGALTCVDGGTQRTASAVPSIDMAQNNSTVNRYIIQHNGTGTKTFRFRLRNQNGAALNTYNQYGTVAIVASYAGTAL